VCVAVRIEAGSKPLFTPKCLHRQGIDHFFPLLQREARNAVSDGATPVASALTKVVDNHKLHERQEIQEIVDPIYYPPASARPSHALFSITSTRLSVEQWVAIAERHTALTTSFTSFVTSVITLRK
jgi:hypothetical protein